jgi:RHS repeat-associated protein
MTLGRNENRYLYEEENRLWDVTVWPPGQEPQWVYVFQYDGLSRIRQRLTYQWQPGVGWNHVNTTRYMYDGRQLVEERYASDHVWATYVHGIDLSGTFEGAGGIGSFLGRRFASGEKFYYHADAMGNVTALVDAWQNLAGTHKYDAFGGEISTSGYWATINPIRFSSKVLQGGGIYDYGLRFYDPGLQRWLNRDPIEEKGGINMYQFVRNDPSNHFDPDGRIVVPALVIGAAVLAGWSFYKMLQAIKNNAENAENAAHNRERDHENASDPTLPYCPIRESGVRNGMNDMGPDFYDMATGPGTLGGGPAGSATKPGEAAVSIINEKIKPEP